MMGKAVLAVALAVWLIVPVARANAAMPQATTAPAAAPADDAVITAAGAQIKTSNPQKAIDTLNPLIARIESGLRTEKRKMYCGMTSAETLAYLTQAASEKRDAVALAPTLCDALFLKAFALVDLNRVADAQAIFQRLIGLAPLHSQYYSELGNTYRLQNNFPASLAAYRNAETSAALADKSDLTRRQCVALRGQGFILTEQGQFDEAEKAYRKCLQVTPGDPKSLEELEYIKQQRAKKR